MAENLVYLWLQKDPIKVFGFCFYKLIVIWNTNNLNHNCATNILLNNYIFEGLHLWHFDYYDDFVVSTEPVYGKGLSKMLGGNYTVVIKCKKW